jgi:hypothetical protein
MACLAGLRLCYLSLGLVQGWCGAAGLGCRGRGRLDQGGDQLIDTRLRLSARTRETVGLQAIVSLKAYQGPVQIFGLRRALGLIEIFRSGLV